MFWDYIESLLNSNSNSTQRNSYLYQAKKKSKTKKKSKNIEFIDVSSVSGIENPDRLNEYPPVERFKEFIKDLQDPISGDPIHLDIYETLYRCTKCTVVYLKDSFDFLLQQNYGKCVSCGSTNIEALIYDGDTIKVQKFNPEFVTLDNYKFFVGRSVKFYGKVVKILESRRGDYALMFEDKPWVEGFKLVVFYPIMDKGKGLHRIFLQSLVGKEILVRGLLQKHDVFGYEILIFKRNMILDIKSV